MFAKVALRIVLAILLVAVLVGTGVYIYRVGLAQGLASSSLSLPQEDGAAAGYPYYPHFYRPWGFGFFPFGWVFPLFFGLLLFGFISRLLFGGWRYRVYRHWRGMHWGGRLGSDRGFDPKNVPPFVEEWHRKMHGEGAAEDQEET